MDQRSLNQYIEGYKKRGLKLFTTSSFQSHSLVLLHMLSRIDNHLAVVFINTGYHFPETIEFKDRIVELFDLKNVIDLHSETPKSMQRGPNGRLLFASDPDHCCYLNKTQPLESILRTYDIWINGVRADQSDARKSMKIEQKAPFNTIRLHPMLDWTSKMVYEYREKYDLPIHPLEEKGYLSIGCEPCTRKFDLGMQERESRWYGLKKIECGLHIDLIAT